MAVNYDRRVLNQSGTGHFSPIGAYESTRDLVLILDVARFKYPPHWVPLDNLLNAMRSVDPATKQPRGFIVMEKPSSQAEVPVVFTINSSIGNSETWSKLAKWLESDKDTLSAMFMEFLADFRLNLSDDMTSFVVKLLSESDVFLRSAALFTESNDQSSSSDLMEIQGPTLVHHTSLSGCELHTQLRVLWSLGVLSYTWFSEINETSGCSSPKSSICCSGSTRASRENVPDQIKSLIGFDELVDGIKSIEPTDNRKEILFNELKILADRMSLIHRNAVLQG
jgi:hypothetical protein